MKKLNQLILINLFATLLFVSCNSDDESPKGVYESGIIVVNEGNYTDADGSLSHISSLGEVTNNIFSQANNGAILGDVVQSIFINEEEAYVIVNNSNRIEVINVNTAERIATIEANLPRYMTVANGKGYITEWGSDFATPRVVVIDLQSHEVMKKIEVGSGAEQIVVVNDKLYISDSFTNSITVIDSKSDEVLKTITTDYPGLTGMVVGVDDNVWSFFAAQLGGDAAFVVIDTSDDTLIESIDVGGSYITKIAISPDNREIYYANSKGLHSISTSSDELIFYGEVFQEPDAVSFYGLAVNPDNGDIYLGDSKSFQGNGVVYQYNSRGEQLNTFDVGRGPNGFVFR